MASDYGWIGLRKTARILEISVDELIDGMFEGWAPTHEFAKNYMVVRFRWTDVYVWKLNNGWGIRAYRERCLYGS